MLEALIKTISILSSNFGVVLALIILLYVIQRITSGIIQSSFKRGGYYLSACFGVAIHELSHAAMCLVFGHKINKIVLFKPDASGTLGYVEHTYNTRNVYHQLGNFFIGMAPLLGGPLAIIAITMLCLPNGQSIVDFLFSAGTDLQSVNNLSSLMALLQYQIQGLFELLPASYEDNTLGFCIWLYLSSSIALHLSPSPVDLKGSIFGGLLLLVVLVCLPLIMDLDTLYASISSILIPLSTILILCIALATGLSIIIFSVSRIFTRN